MAYIISLLIIISLSLLITYIAGLALIHTGLSKDAARLQARSAFTGTGFTTTESEHVVNHPVRRKILMMLIFLGNVGIISTISSAILGLITLKESEFITAEILVLVFGLLVLWVLSRSKWFHRKLSHLVHRMLDR